MTKLSKFDNSTIKRFIALNSKKIKQQDFSESKNKSLNSIIDYGTFNTQRDIKYTSFINKSTNEESSFTPLKSMMNKDEKLITQFDENNISFRLIEDKSYKISPKTIRKESDVKMDSNIKITNYLDKSLKKCVFNKNNKKIAEKTNKDSKLIKGISNKSSNLNFTFENLFQSKISFEITSIKNNKLPNNQTNIQSNYDSMLVRHVRNLSDNISANSSLNIMSVFQNENNESSVIKSKIFYDKIENESIEDLHFVFVKCFKKSRQLTSIECDNKETDLNRNSNNLSVIKFDKEIEIL